MQFSDKVYNILKWIIVIVMPAVAAAVVSIGKVFNWAPATQISECIVIAQVLLGAVFCVGSATYYAKQANGQITLVANTDTETTENTEKTEE